jgi:hypothetical protein
MRTHTKFFSSSKLANVDGAATVVRIAMVWNDLAIATSLLGNESRHSLTRNQSWRGSSSAKLQLNQRSEIRFARTTLAASKRLLVLGEQEHFDQCAFGEKSQTVTGKSTR